MTLTQITLAFFGLMAVIVVAMIVHGYLDKRRITKSFRALARSLPGEMFQESPFVYPHLVAALEGRKVSVFFQVVKVGRKHILYLIYSVGVQLGFSLLLLKEQFFRPKGNEGELAEAIGPILPRMDERYLARSKEAEAAASLFQRADLSTRLNPIEEFTSVLIGPDSIVAGKPYEGLSDVRPEYLLQNIRSLKEMSLAVERASKLTPTANGAGREVLN
ncbi:MAG TPA: hypothetical protein VFG95_04460 [Nitrospiria bacterium]|nr:hypothetical protein [Nitrospiria bacterium]